MSKLVGRRNAFMAQVKWELSTVKKLHERKASLGEATDRQQQLVELARNFRQTQSEIEEEQTDPEAIASVFNVRDEFFSCYYEAKDIVDQYVSMLRETDQDDDAFSNPSDRTIAGSCKDLREAMQMLLETQRAILVNQSAASRNAMQNRNVNGGGEQVSNHAPLNVKLPTINVPVFSGDRKSWRSFKDIFETTIHNQVGIKDSVKMQYLVSYLEGDAKRLVSSFPISDANYVEAWEALTSFYDKKKFTVFALVREFVDQPEIRCVTSTNLRKLVTTSDEVVRQLNALGDEFNTRDPWLIHLLLEKLDGETRSLWAQRIVDEENPTFADFLKFLDDRCDALETCTAFSRKVTADDGKKGAVRRVFQSEKKVHALHGSTEVKKCAKCSSEHPIFLCEDFKKLSVQCRREFVQKAKLCYNCLRPSHSVKVCSSRSVCHNGDCKQRHHTLLCPKEVVVMNQSIDRSSDVPAQVQQAEETINAMVAHVPTVAAPNVSVLPTALICVKASDGNFVKVRALIDSGSEASLISEATVNKLRLPRSSGKFVVSGLGQQQAGTTRGIVELVIANRFSEEVILRTRAFVMNKLTSTLPSQHLRMDSSLLNEEVKRNLADPEFYRPGPIDVVLGSDVFLLVLQAGQVRNSSCVPVAQNTVFGYVVSGNQAVYAADIQSNFSIVCLHTELDINRTLRQFWEQEEVPRLHQLDPSEQAAVAYFKSTVSRDENGRFIVRLPFDDSKPALGESLTAAMKRLRSMERRFQRDPGFAKQYSNFMREYLDLHHMEEVPDSEISVEASESFYLPHHAVVKAESTTTKLRVVFDASCASGSGMSLNDRLLPGPNVNQDLLFVLLRFRMHKVAIAGDVEKMYRQVWVHPADRDYQRVVWRENQDEKVKHYRLCTVTYGTSSAPYLAIEAMKEAARSYSTVYPEAAQAIIFDTYVDDFLSGAETKDGAMQLRSQVVEILKSAGFNLRKWSSNCEELLRDVDSSELNVRNVRSTEHENTVKALGIQWLPDHDTFAFRVNLQQDNVNTKRQLLSDASKLFDPFGWLSPVTVSIKILFQQLWLSDVSWDDPLPLAIEEPWIRIKQNLHKVEQIRIPRFAANYNGKVELHGFADASEAAYGAVVYTRARDPDGNIVVNLLAAKTKVAPIKQVSLPRLELSAAVLLTELMESITKAMSHLAVELWAWTDSTIVLQWLSAHPRKWKTYVANRTSAVLTFLPRERWNHVTSADNPADCASRGLTPDEFVNHQLWFQGPDWLSMDEEHWRTGGELPAITEQPPEERMVKVMHAVTQLRSNYFAERIILQRRSSFTLVVRSLAVFHRSLQAWKGKKFESGLTPDELQSVKAKLARMAQEDVYKQEMELLAKGSTLPAKSKLASLYPFLDSNGTMRVGGRLQNSTYSYEVKHPIVLPGDHRVTELLLRDLHQRNLHAGPTLLTATMNQQYWVVGLRTAVRRTIQKCTRCVKLKGQTASQLMGSLPVPRVMGTRSFVHVGVDYAGPFTIRATCVRGVKTTKGYLAVFICMSTKAVHLEVASDLSTGTFISALKRFIARRGYPSEIWSDNGTNFVGADRYLRELQQALQDNGRSAEQFLTNLGIKWIFNPPSAPHRGGIWEAAVKSVKGHLLAVMESESTTYEDLSTILTQVEACLNSRPLCALSSMPDSYDALTPGHFLIGQPLNLLPEPNVSRIPTNRLDMWQRMHKKTIEVWKRWRDEYVASLQPRTKWRVNEANVKENQLVVVKNDNSPPAQQWELARIVKVHPDSAGVVRTVTLRRGQAEYLRPIQKICPLPTD